MFVAALPEAALGAARGCARRYWTIRARAGCGAAQRGRQWSSSPPRVALCHPRRARRDWPIRARATGDDDWPDWARRAPPVLTRFVTERRRPKEWRARSVTCDPSPSRAPTLCCRARWRGGRTCGRGVGRRREGGEEVFPIEFLRGLASRHATYPSYQQNISHRCACTNTVKE